MLRVKFLSASTLPALYYLRQFPGRRPVWGSCEFLIGDSETDVDYCVVYDDVAGEQELRCPAGNKILVTAEPPEVREYDRDFLAQFDYVVGVDRNIDHPHMIFSQQALSWMVGWKFFREEQGEIKDYDLFSTYDFSNKPNLLAVVASKKMITKGHAIRYEFARGLKAHFGDRMDMYGLGIQEIEDKWDALATYKYALAIENSVIPDYWTEKISDAYLAQSFPFYYGCPNLEDYFPAESFQRININRIQESVDIIEEAIENDLRKDRMDNLLKARDLVLNEHNVFAMLARLIAGFEQNKTDRNTTNGQNVASIKILPHSDFRRNIWKRLKRKIFA